MRKIFGQGGEFRLNVVSVFIYIIVIGGLYGLWKYAPVYWQRENLIEIVQNAMLDGNRYGFDRIQSKIIENADRSLKLTLTNDNIKVDRIDNRILIEVTYKVKVEHLFDKVTFHIMRIKEERTLID